jgi:3-hydroxyacyl-CoA dehydrogenase
MQHRLFYLTCKLFIPFQLYHFSCSNCFVIFDCSVQKTPLSERRLSSVKVPGDVSKGHLDDLEDKIKKETVGRVAPNLIFQAVKASATLPFEAGKEIEMAIFKELSGGFQAKALQYQFFAERKVSLPPSSADEKNIPNIQAVSVVGGGTMGTGIVMSLINAGIHVVWVESSEESMDAAMARIGSTYRASSAYKSGKMSEADVLKRYQLITPTTEMEKLKHSDMVIEAVYEDMAVKKDIFEKLDKICKPTAVLATNTSTMDIDEIASAASKSRAPYIVGTRKWICVFIR